MKSLCIAILLMLIPFASAYPRTGVAVFPFKGTVADSLNTWIRYGLAETISRKIHSIDEFQVWDPIFLYRSDSSCYDLNSDSLLKIHKVRWQWDAAIGGTYHLVKDSLYVKIVVVNPGQGSNYRQEISLSATQADFYNLCNTSISSILAVLKYKVSATDSQKIYSKPIGVLPAYSTYAQGYGYEMVSRNNAAISAYSRATQIDQHFALPLIRQARLYSHGGEITIAKQLFEKAVQLEPKDVEIAAAYSEFLIDYQMPTEASKFIESRRMLLNSSSEGMRAIGKFYVATGEYQRAISILSRAIASRPVDLEAQYALGNAYLVSGEFTAAADIFNSLIKIRPDHVRYYSSLGASYRKTGRLMESMMVLEAAHKMDNNNTAILVDLAHTYLLLTLYDKAEKLLERAHELAPDVSDILINMGVVYWHKGRIGQAKNAFNEAAKVSTTRRSALTNNANVLYLSGKPDKAIKMYRKADKAGKKHEAVQYNLAWAYYTKGKLKEASKYFDEVLRLSPARVDVLLLQASIALKRGDEHDAESYYRKILDISPYQEFAIRELVKLCIAQKRYEEAIKPVESYLEHLPNNREFMVLLAELYRSMGWYEVSAMKYQFVIRDFPTDPAGYLGMATCMYEAIKYKDSKEYDRTIHALKDASDKDPNNPQPDLMAGEIYKEYKLYNELAIDHWNKALNRAQDPSLKRTIIKKISSIKK